MVGANRLAVFVLATMWACRRPVPDAEPTIVGKHAVVRLDPAGGELAAQLDRQAGKARARSLRPVVELRAEWCEPCKKLEAGGPELDAALEGTYLVQLDVDAWAGRLGAFAAPAIPVFFAIDEHGRPTGRRLDGASIRGDDAKAFAAPLAAFLRTP